MEEQVDQHDAQRGQTDPPTEPQPSQNRCETCKKDRKKVCLMPVKPLQTLLTNSSALERLANHAATGARIMIMLVP